MAFKIKPILTPRQLRRVKFIMCASSAILLCLGIMSNFVEGGAEEKPVLKWDSKEWQTMEVEEYPRGRIVYFSTNSEVCLSPLLIPGIATMSTGVLSVAYGLCLVYLFMGIGIVAEIFMEAIEKITSEKVVINIVDNDGNERQQKLLRWNGTVANLTLMALGSSAPEILLAVLETSTNLGKCPGELGASTIVGSAAFNLLVISGLSIYAVSPENDTEPDRDTEVKQGYKRIYDMRVFTITATSSIWAYIWLWIVLLDQKVSVTEAILTFVYFFILIILAYGADKVTANAAKKKAEKENKGKVDDTPVIKYSANEITRALIEEKQGGAKSEVEERKLDEMKRFLKRSMGTDRIEDLN